MRLRLEIGLCKLEKRRPSLAVRTARIRLEAWLKAARLHGRCSD